LQKLEKAKTQSRGFFLKCKIAKFLKRKSGGQAPSLSRLSFSEKPCWEKLELEKRKLEKRRSFFFSSFSFPEKHAKAEA